MDPVSTLELLGGASRRTELLRAGASHSGIVRGLNAGAIVKTKSVYHLPGIEEDVIRAREFRAHLACVSACAHLGLPLVQPPALPHLAVARDRGHARRGVRDFAGVVMHRDDAVDALSRTPTGATARLLVPPAVAVDQTARCLSPLQQLALVDSLMFRGSLTRARLARFEVGKCDRRLWLVRHASALSESLLESIARGALVTVGLGVEQQMSIPGVGRVDLVVGGRLVVELDGREHHSDVRAFATDRQRDRQLLLQGYKVMRFTYADVVFRTTEMVDSIAAVLKVSLGVRARARLEWACSPHTSSDPSSLFGT